MTTLDKDSDALHLLPRGNYHFQFQITRSADDKMLEKFSISTYDLDAESIVSKLSLSRSTVCDDLRLLSKTNDLGSQEGWLSFRHKLAWDAHAKGDNSGCYVEPLCIITRERMQAILAEKKKSGLKFKRIDMEKHVIMPGDFGMKLKKPILLELFYTKLPGNSTEPAASLLPMVLFGFQSMTLEPCETFVRITRCERAPKGSVRLLACSTVFIPAGRRVPTTLELHPAALDEILELKRKAAWKRSVAEAKAERERSVAEAKAERKRARYLLLWHSWIRQVRADLAAARPVVALPPKGKKNGAVVAAPPETRVYAPKLSCKKKTPPPRGAVGDAKRVVIGTPTSPPSRRRRRRSGWPPRRTPRRGGSRGRAPPRARDWGLVRIETISRASPGTGCACGGAQ